MANFGWTRVNKPAQAEDAASDLRGLTDPAAFLAALDKVVPRYLDLADNGVLVYPACKRKPGDLLGDARAVWEHTRLEAMRYIPMVPRRNPRCWSILPARPRPSTLSCASARTTAPSSISRAQRSRTTASRSMRR